ncbi:MAG TPA: LCP family protein, partial [Ktedonobacteraceae bacterium]|nr:LCP family protein [Ktedonobacteraceae bacterium]
LSGDQALEYVRSRHADLVGDIGRTQRQQEVLQALKQKLNMSAIFDHLGELFHDLVGKAYTDLSQDELVSLGTFARKLPSQAISRLTLGPGHGKQNYGMLTHLVDPDLGSVQDVVLPNCANIQPEMNNIFNLGNAQSCQVDGPVSELKPHSLIAEKTPRKTDTS